MSVTFELLQEAREYQKRMAQTEQLASKIRREGSKYVVTLLGKEPIKIKTLTDAEVEEYGLTGGTHATDEEGTHRIYLAPKVGTTTRLHEIGHARLGHRTTGGVTLPERIDRELEAEIYAWQARDKELNAHVGWNAVRTALEINPKGDPVSIVNAVSRKIEEKGISVSKEDKGWFLETLFTKYPEEVEELKKQF